MEGADIYEAFQIDGEWIVNVRSGTGRSSPALNTTTSAVADVKNAAVECASDFGVEFTRAEVAAGAVHVITAWSADGTFDFGYHGSNRNVRILSLISIAGCRNG